MIGSDILRTGEAQDVPIASPDGENEELQAIIGYKVRVTRGAVIRAPLLVWDLVTALVNGGIAAARKAPINGDKIFAQIARRLGDGDDARTEQSRRAAVEGLIFYLRHACPCWLGVRVSQRMRGDPVGTDNYNVVVSPVSIGYNDRAGRHRIGRKVVRQD